MKVVLTGASGFLGRRVLRRLTTEGIEVVAVGRSRPPGFDGPFIQVDLLQPDAASAIVEHAEAAQLMHLAWYAEHGKYSSSPLNFRWVEASLRLVEAFCAGGGEKVVMAGTCAEYDWAGGYHREDASLIAPASVYGVAKDAGRRLIAAQCQLGGVPFAWGRIFFPYGAGEDRRRLIPSLLDVFRGRCEPFGVNGGAYRDFIHVEDVASAFAHLLSPGAEGCFNISSGCPTQIAEVVRGVARHYSADPEIVLSLSGRREGEPEMIVGSNRKLKSLGWAPVYTVTDIADVYDR